MFGLGATKTRLTMTRYNLNADGSVTIDSANKFTVMLNPESFTHSKSIDYGTAEPMGAIGSEKKFNKVNPESVKFNFWLDGTGAVPTDLTETAKDVKTLMQDL